MGWGAVSLGVVSSNQVARTDWTPMRLAELAVLMLFSAQAMVYGWDHPCWHENCDKLHVPDDLQILSLDFRRDASYLTIDYSGVDQN